MKNKKKILKIMLQVLVLILVGGYLTTSVIQSTFASNTNKKPNAVITINKDGSITQEGNLFEGGLLYPSTIQDAEKGIGGMDGIIRINNQYKTTDISNLGIKVDKDNLKIGNQYPKDIVYNSFLDDIQIKVEKGSLFSFNETLVEYTSIRELLYQLGNKDHNGYTLDDEITIDKGSTVDLKYRLHMNKDAGGELEAVTAEMPIYVNVHESPIVDDDKDNDDKDKKRTSTQRIVVEDDIEDDQPHWSHDCIITLLEHQVIHGYTTDTISLEDYLNKTIDPVIYVNKIVKPERLITRAETSVLVGRALGLEEQAASSTEYADYIPNWASGYVAVTTEANIFMGYPSGMFKSNNYITREEMMAVLTRAFNIILENESLELSFEDKDKIGNWAVRYVKAGYENKVIEGYPDGTYKPKNNITRAETFTIICKLMGLHEVEH